MEIYLSTCIALTGISLALSGGTDHGSLRRGRRLECYTFMDTTACVDSGPSNHPWNNDNDDDDADTKNEQKAGMDPLGKALTSIAFLLIAVSVLWCLHYFEGVNYSECFNSFKKKSADESGFTGFMKKLSSTKAE